MNNVKVLTPGMFTTVQDMGRYGYQRFGIPVAGVMDEYSYKIANYLVGNDENEAVLEMTFIGSNLEFAQDMVIAITGAEIKAYINNIEIPLWQSIAVKKGDILSFSGIRKGIRAYVAFGGELNVPVINGSKSTIVKSKLGGFDGRALKKGDELEILVSHYATAGKKLDEKYIPKINTQERIRVLLGPQDDYFTEEGKKAFFAEKGYEVTAQSDRMGMRLSGEAVKHIEKADIISDGAVIGSIQIPADGMPIILMADRQTTGGYTKIGTVIKEDICKLAQMGQNSKIIFENIDINQAQEKYIEFYSKLDEIKKQIEKYQVESSPTPQVDKSNPSTKELKKVNPDYVQNDKAKFTTLIDGKEFSVEIQKCRF